MTVYTLRHALGYKGFAAFKANWFMVHGGCELADESVLEDGMVCAFLHELSTTKRGRSKDISRKAQLLLEQMQCCEQVESLEKADTAIEKAVELLPNDKKAAFAPDTLTIVFGFVIVLTCYGLVYLLSEMGAALAVVYSLVCIHAISMAKDRYSQQTAKQGIVAICVLELLAFFVHLAMFNMRLWDANQAGKLPFSVQDGWMHIPFVIALCLALLVSLTAIYAVTTTLSLTKEKVRAENWESENTGQKW